MNLIFLGTSSGVPTKSRNVSGVALRESKGRGWYLVDCGEGTQHQLLHTPLSVNDLKALFITHVHGDHCYGLPGLLACAGMNGRKKPLKIVAPKGIKEWLLATQLNTELYLTYDLEFIETEGLSDLAFNDMNISTVKLSHRVPSFAYVFTEKDSERALDVEKLIQDGIPKGPIWGMLCKGQTVEYEGRQLHAEDYLLSSGAFQKVVIAGDNDEPSLLEDACADAQVLVHEATYTKELGLKLGKEVGHSYAEQVALFAEHVKLPNLVLTHFSARYQSFQGASSSIDEIKNEAESVFTGNLFLAKDFDSYSLNKSGEFTLLE
jgi:ribonuclease Z